MAQTSISGNDVNVERQITYGVHSPPQSVGAMFAATQPKLAAMYHLEINDGEEALLLDGVRGEYAGPVVIGRDLMVFNISHDQVTQRSAVAPDDALLIVEPTDDFEPLDEPGIPMSGWLMESIVPVAGVDAAVGTSS